MGTLEIISSQKTVNARQQIAGNTVNFTWNNLDEETPSIINFNVQRGYLGEPEYTGNFIISGAYYADQNKFDIQNNNFADGDFDLYANILLTCKNLTTKTPNNGL